MHIYSHIYIELKHPPSVDFLLPFPGLMELKYILGPTLSIIFSINFEVSTKSGTCFFLDNVIMMYMEINQCSEIHNVHPLTQKY